MNRTSLRGASIIIAYRQASRERHENLLATIRFLQQAYDDFELIVVEGDTRPAFDFHENFSENTRYFFYEDHGPFNRSHLLNQGTRFSTSGIICFHDADMIGWPHLMRHAVDTLMDGDDSDARTPHWSILNVAGDLKRGFCRTLDFAVLARIDPAHLPRGVNVLYENQASGITFWKKEKFISIGGYDERFLSWGGEDDELLIRATRLGVRWNSVPSPTFHLHHDASDRVEHAAITNRNELKNSLIAFAKECDVETLHEYAKMMAKLNFG
jgi:predicted glycosyltransferase involved in capsule biosynthesis